jgi:hypothetical protein
MESEGWMQFLKDDSNEDEVTEEEVFDHLHNLSGVTIPNLSVLVNACLGTSVGMFARFLKHNINTETGTAGPLME